MIEIRLSEKCNLKCVFCHIPQLKPKTLNFEQVILLLRSYDHSVPTHFVITGGEPTLIPYLEKLFKVIKKLNSKHIICIQTNGLFLGNYNFTKELISAGLDELLLSFHSHEEITYEKITGIKGSFKRILNAFEVLNKFNLKIEISFVICKFNYLNIRDTFVFLKRNIDFYGVTIANIFEKINYQNDNIYNIRISNIEASLYKALVYLKDNDKQIINCGIPMCYLYGFEYTYMIGQYEQSRYFTKGICCKKCIFNNYCRGLIGEYADLYGTDELKIVTNINSNLLNIIRYNMSKYNKGIEFNNSTT